MNRKLFQVLSLAIPFGLLLAACQPAAPGAQVEVTRIVEVTSAAGGGADATPVVQQVPVTFAEAGDTLQAVQDRGVLRCGGNANLPGFGFLAEDGTFSGFDVDYCKAVAAAVLGDSTKFELRPTTG